MIREIADAQVASDDLAAMTAAGSVVGLVILVHDSDGGFHSIWTPAVEERGLVTMIGELEFLKRDMMKKIYGA